MKRVINFEGDNENTRASKKQKQFHDKQEEREKMLAFRKQLPIYAGNTFSNAP